MHITFSLKLQFGDYVLARAYSDAVFLNALSKIVSV